MLVAITGGSSGIGKATARLLVQQGNDVLLLARNPQRLASAQAELDALRATPQQQVQVCAVDVTDRAAVQAALAAQPVQALITSAGVVLPGPFASHAALDFEQQMAINYYGTLYAIQAVLPQMLARCSGHLVLISSVAGLLGVYGYTGYCASKFAVRGLAEALRSELKPHGIAVSIVYPPDTDTPMLAAEQAQRPAATRLIAASTGVLPAEQVARAIVYGMRRKAFVIAPGAEAQCLARLHSIINPLVQIWMDRLVRRAMQESRDQSGERRLETDRMTRGA